MINRSHISQRSALRSRKPALSSQFNISRYISHLLLAILAIIIFSAPSFADVCSQNIRVGLTHSIGKPLSVNILCKGLFRIYSGKVQLHIADVENKQVLLSLKNKTIEVTVDGIVIGTSTDFVRLVPENRESISEVIQPKAKYKLYRYTIEITVSGGLTVINELPLEDYVRGVVPSEIPKNFHSEAQKALTTAARTYALKSRGRHKSQGFDLCDSTDCQGFAGASREAEWIDKIVDETLGRIITYNGEPIYALYSTDCGGMTQNNEDYGAGKSQWPYLRSIVDSPCPVGENGEVQSAYCSADPYHTWTNIYTKDELERVLVKSNSVRVGRLQSIEFTDYDCSGRVKTVKIMGDTGECRMSGGRFREIFGHSVIKSTKMKLTVTSEGKYIIEGKGYGHGVGMCAFGANGLAKSKVGITYEDILKHYYTGVEIVSLPDEKAVDTDTEILTEPEKTDPSESNPLQRSKWPVKKK